MLPKDIDRTCLRRQEPPGDTPFTNLTSIGGILFLGKGEDLVHPSGKTFKKKDVQRVHKAWHQHAARKGYKPQSFTDLNWRDIVIGATKGITYDRNRGRTRYYLDKNITFDDFCVATNWINDACGYVMYSHRGPSITVKTWDEDRAEAELKRLRIGVRKRVRFKSNIV